MWIKEYAADPVTFQQKQIKLLPVLRNFTGIFPAMCSLTKIHSAKSGNAYKTTSDLFFSEVHIISHSFDE